ncbi:hypothetical protein KIPB_001384 [Kipferlia bialata]|uniref:Transmembrane protein n=1 Tax=Kipferlia bialata TaxID=797122 RepID=A0A9K3GFX0_9EUKA|nr:hypothetical protein KIPB_001384 [Kipferlia bialata]|eukprot:g1384.t1
MSLEATGIGDAGEVRGGECINPVAGEDREGGIGREAVVTGDEASPPEPDAVADTANVDLAIQQMVERRVSLLVMYTALGTVLSLAVVIGALVVVVALSTIYAIAPLIVGLIGVLSFRALNRRLLMISLYAALAVTLFCCYLAVFYLALIVVTLASNDGTSLELSSIIGVAVGFGSMALMLCQLLLTQITIVALYPGATRLVPLSRCPRAITLCAAPLIVPHNPKAEDCPRETALDVPLVLTCEREREREWRSGSRASGRGQSARAQETRHSRELPDTIHPRVGVGNTQTERAETVEREGEGEGEREAEAEQASDSTSSESESIFSLNAESDTEADGEGGRSPTEAERNTHVVTACHIATRIPPGEPVLGLSVQVSRIVLEAREQERQAALFISMDPVGKGRITHRDRRKGCIGVARMPNGENWSPIDEEQESRLARNRLRGAHHEAYERRLANHDIGPEAYGSSAIMTAGLCTPGASFRYASTVENDVAVDCASPNRSRGESMPPPNTKQVRMPRE